MEYPMVRGQLRGAAAVPRSAGWRPAGSDTAFTGPQNLSSSTGFAKPTAPGITARQKGAMDRVTMLPQAVKGPLMGHLKHVREIH